MEKAAKTVATNLKEIHDKKLYQTDYRSFEAYLENRWGISRRRGYQIIEAQNTRLMLGDAVKDDPAASAALESMSEAAVRELGKRSEPIKVLKEVVVKNPKPKLRDVMKQRKELEVCPTCKRPI